ncbi:MAG: hypothetical protein ACXU95_13530, partial [Isosphaeraceae bacterium]
DLSWEHHLEPRQSGGRNDSRAIAATPRRPPCRSAQRSAPLETIGAACPDDPPANAPFELPAPFDWT